jgi:hypothetical protein
MHRPVQSRHHPHTRHRLACRAGWLADQAMKHKGCATVQNVLLILDAKEEYIFQKSNTQVTQAEDRHTPQHSCELCHWPKMSIENSSYLFVHHNVTTRKLFMCSAAAAVIAVNVCRHDAGPPPQPLNSPVSELCAATCRPPLPSAFQNMRLLLNPAIGQSKHQAVHQT